MATTEAYLTFLLHQLEGISGISSKKMFGEYLIYCNGKPVLTVCDNTVFVKKLPEIAALLQGAPEDAPYPGAKPQFILDIEDPDADAACSQHPGRDRAAAEKEKQEKGGRLRVICRYRVGRAAVYGAPQPVEEPSLQPGTDRVLNIYE